MSIHQPIKMPVTKFSSDDADAPQLSNSGAAGEVKTILKACLKTGYGNKTPSTGWDMPFEDGNKAVFKNTDPRGTGFCLRLDNNYSKKGKISCYKSMTDLDTGEKKWFDNEAGLMHYGSRTRKWRLLATPTTFVFITHTSNFRDNFPALMFGDFMTTKNNDVGNCLIRASYTYQGGSDYDWGGFTRTSYQISAVAHKYNDDTSPLLNWFCSTLGGKSKQASPISTNKLFHPAYLMESNYERGVMPFQIASHSESIGDFTEVTINGRPYLLVQFGGAEEVTAIPTDYWLL